MDINQRYDKILTTVFGRDPVYRLHLSLCDSRATRLTRGLNYNKTRERSRLRLTILYENNYLFLVIADTVITKMLATELVLWVRQEDEENALQVKTEKCRNVDDFLEAVQLKLGMTAHPQRINLHPSTQSTKYPRDKLISDFFQDPYGPGMSFSNPLIVKIIGKPLSSHVLSSHE